MLKNLAECIGLEEFSPVSSSFSYEPLVPLRLKNIWVYGRVIIDRS